MYNIITLNNINELSQDILKIINTTDTINDKLLIYFDNDSDKSIDSFFLNIKNKNKDYYFMSNDYTFQLDLLDSFIDDYLNIYIWFIKCVEIANNIINSKSNQYIKLFGSNILIWKISICKNIMFNYPFTLDDIIFIPINYIISEYKSIKSNKIINTLIHEKIHISQRFNEFIWEQFIKQNNEWQKILPETIEFNLIESNINFNYNLLEKEQDFIFNPDTTYNNFKYIWNGNDGKKYYGHYIHNNKNKKISKKYFQIDMEKSILIPTIIDLDEEHPYEIYAYKIANELVNNL